jgi:hypothetical protein
MHLAALTGASIAIDDCYELWESGFISIPHNFQLSDLRPELRKLLGSSSSSSGSSSRSSGRMDGITPVQSEPAQPLPGCDSSFDGSDTLAAAAATPAHVGTPQGLDYPTNGGLHAGSGSPVQAGSIFMSLDGSPAPQRRTQQHPRQAVLWRRRLGLVSRVQKVLTCRHLL